MTDHRRAGAPEHTIVVGVDGSELSRQAVLWAADEAELRHATLDVVHGGSGDLPHLGTPRSTDVPPTTAGAVVDEAIRLATSRRPDIVVRGETSDRPAARALIDTSEGTDLLVVGARGKGGFSGLLLGSVSHRCIQYARCPVVVVRPTAPDDDVAAADRTIIVGIDGSAGSDLALRWTMGEAA
ncbi:MAG TPA: universal stress protein, partial [Acidimicrobiales bacterium]|nr:universal stress protein [Acidimicrobiales bacterium]